MKLKKFVCILLVAVMVIGFGLSPISFAHVNAHGGSEGIPETQVGESEDGQDVEPENRLDDGLENSLGGNPEDYQNGEPVYEETEEPTDDETEGYIDSWQEEQPLDCELLLLMDEFGIEAANDEEFVTMMRVQASILAAGGIHFADTSHMWGATTRLYLHMDLSQRNMLRWFTDNLDYVEGTSTMAFTASANVLTPIWEAAGSLFAVHEVNGRQVGKIFTDAQVHGHFHIGNHIGESVIPVLCWDSLPIDAFGGGLGLYNVNGIIDPIYINALINIFPSSITFRGNIYTTGFRLFFGDLLTLRDFRNGVDLSNLNSVRLSTGASITPLGFVILDSWGAERLHFAHLHTAPDGIVRLFFAWTSYSNLWSIFPANTSAVVGNLATENILTNVAFAQAAFLDAAGFAAPFEAVKIRVPNDAQTLVGAIVTDVVIPNRAPANPSYAAIRVLSSIMAAGGIYFENTEYMNAFAIRLYRRIGAYYRYLVNYKANNLIYVDDTDRATRWESMDLYSIWEQADVLFRNHLSDDEQKIETISTSVVDRPLYFHLGYYTGYSTIPVINIDTMPTFSSFDAHWSFPVSVPFYVNTLISMLPRTVAFAGDYFSSSVGPHPFDAAHTNALFVYRNGMRTEGQWWGYYYAAPNWIPITPIGFALVMGYDSTSWRLVHVHLVTEYIGGVFFDGVELYINDVTPLNFADSLVWYPRINSKIPYYFTPFSTTNLITAHLSPTNLITNSTQAWQAVRTAANIPESYEPLTNYTINLWFPPSTHDLVNATVTDVVIPDPGNISRRTGIVRYASPINHTHDHSVMFVYDDAYFFQSAYEYNPSLATLSLMFQLSAWGSNDVDDYAYKMQNAENFFYDLDFVGFEHNFTDFTNHGIVGKPTKDSIGAVAAHRVISNEDPQTGYTSEYTLIALAIRGGGYESEWASNFTIGRSGHHQGFYQSSNIAAQFLRDYINSQGITGDIKLWLTGFSRAGAVANVLAGGINSGRVTLPSGVTLESHNFFTYTFATPAGVLRSSAVRFGNIHNIIHLSDPVPMVAPLYWDFMRYGIDWELPSRLTEDPFTYELRSSHMQQHFNVLESVVENNTQYYLDDFTMMIIHIDGWAILPGGNPFISIQEDILNTQPQNVFLFDYVTTLTRDFIRTRDNFVDTYQDALRDTAGLIFGTTPHQLDIFTTVFTARLASDMGMLLVDLLRPGGGMGAVYLRLVDSLSDSLQAAGIPYTLEQIDSAVSAIGSLLLVVAVNHPNRALTLAMNLDSIGQAHYPEIYLAWLKSMDPNFQPGGTIDHINTGHFRIIRINCPVDVRVYLNNQLVAAIIDDVPQHISSIVAAVNEDGEKLVFLPATDEYRLVLTATDDSTMTFSVSEFNPHSGTFNRIINYYDIPITAGQRFDAFAGAFSTADLQDTTAAPSSTVYILETDGTIISRCEELTGNQAVNAFYDVSVVPENIMQGIALGSGLRQRGTYAMVTAVPYVGYEFYGWYLDNEILVSNNAEHRFRVMGDTNLTARFVIAGGGSYCNCEGECDCGYDCDCDECTTVFPDPMHGFPTRTSFSRSGSHAFVARDIHMDDGPGILFTLEAGQTYTMGLWIMGEGNLGGISLLNMLEGYAVLVSQFYFYPSDTWQRVQLTYTSPEGGLYKLRIDKIDTANPDDANRWYMDDIFVVRDDGYIIVLENFEGYLGPHSMEDGKFNGMWWNPDHNGIVNFMTEEYMFPRNMNVTDGTSIYVFRPDNSQPVYVWRYAQGSDVFLQEGVEHVFKAFVRGYGNLALVYSEYWGNEYLDLGFIDYLNWTEVELRFTPQTTHYSVFKIAAPFGDVNLAIQYVLLYTGIENNQLSNVDFELYPVVWTGNNVTYGVRLFRGIDNVQSVNVISEGDVDTIGVNDTLQMHALALPATATFGDVDWFVESYDGYGMAGINGFGLLTALKDGVVRVIAIASDRSGVYGYMLINIGSQYDDALVISVDAYVTVHDAVGGTSEITVYGVNLINGLLVRAFVNDASTAIYGLTVGSAVNQRVMLDFPANNTHNDIEYIIRVSIDGGHTWDLAAGFVIVRAHEPQAPTRTVHFYSEDVRLANQSQTVDVGYPITKPADPTRQGFTFGGWETVGGVLWDFDAPVYANMNLYARWTAETEPTRVLRGDINGDGTVDWIDVSLMTELMLNPSSLLVCERGRIAADIDGNGVIDGTDMLLLQFHVQGFLNIHDIFGRYVTVGTTLELDINNLNVSTALIGARPNPMTSLGGVGFNTIPIMPLNAGTAQVWMTLADTAPRGYVDLLIHMSLADDGSILHRPGLARAVFELDGYPRWDGANRVAYLYFDDITLRLPVGEELPYGLGTPVMQNSRVFVPLRYVSQMIGAGVFWDAANRAVYVFRR